MNKDKTPMKNGKGCKCGCVKSLTGSNVNSSNHPDPFKSINYNNNKNVVKTKNKIKSKSI